MARMNLGGRPLNANPDTVSWDFKMKTAETETLGGKVVQVYGVEVSDLIIHGNFGPPDRSRGETGSWQVRDRMQAQVERWMTQQVSSKNPQPLSFTYPDRKWSFKVFIKNFNSGQGPFTHANEDFAPDWQLTLFVVSDLTGRVVKGVKDAYLSRLVNGVGWKISSYNGPTQDEIQATLAPHGGSLRAYMEQGLTKMVGGDGSGDSGLGGNAGTIANAGAAAGIAAGASGNFPDIVALGRYLEQTYPGVKCSEHPSFGGVAPVHVTGSDHYIGKAIDVNADGAPGGEKATLDKVNDYAKANGFWTLWQTANHYDHVHISDRRG